MRYTRAASMAAALAIVLCGTADAQFLPPKFGAKFADSVKRVKAKRSGAEAREIQRDANTLLQVKLAAMRALEERATNVTTALGDLAKSGKIPTNDEAIELMKAMVQEMAQIRDELKRLNEEVEGIKGWIEGQNEALPIMAQDISDLKRVKPGNYLQFQYRDSNDPNSRQDAFAARRFRISQTNVIDPKTQMKFSFDVSTGTNTTQAQMRDLILIYDAVIREDNFGLQFLAGQQPLPLGYELERSSSEREFPERARYNTTMFNGERSRGIYAKYGIGNHMFAHAGIWDALAFNDPEQASLAPGPSGRLAGTGGLRYFTPTLDLGVSGLIGSRPLFILRNAQGQITNWSPDVKRQFLYLDGTFIGLLDPRVFVRGELMLGKDRVPNATSPNPNRVAVDMRGWQAQIGFNINYRNQVSLRYEQWDPNTSGGARGDVFSGYGAVYSYWINPGVKLSLAWERFDDPTRNPRKFNITTFRIQYRY